MELTDLTLKNVTDLKDIILVNILDTKTYVDRQFVVNEGIVPNVNLLHIIRKYMSLRTTTKTDRFFVGYRAGKCTAQPVGINTVGAIPKKIAQFLGLPNPALYTGHCFRVTSATLLVDAGASLLALKQHGGWESSKVAEAYVQASLGNKRKIANGILGNHFAASETKRAPLATIFTPNQLACSSNASIPSTSRAAVVEANNSMNLNVQSIPSSNKAAADIAIASSQEIRISTIETRQVTNDGSHDGERNDLNDFIQASRNLQGNNMYKCTINYNFYGKQ